MKLIKVTDEEDFAHCNYYQTRTRYYLFYPNETIPANFYERFNGKISIETLFPIEIIGDLNATDPIENLD